MQWHKQGRISVRDGCRMGFVGGSEKVSVDGIDVTCGRWTEQVHG